MTVLREGELTLTLPDGVHGRHFDDASRGISQMHAVDWIVEPPEHTFFVEVKDILSQAARMHDAGEKFVERFKSGMLISNLVGKFRDTFLYEWACERSVERISYFVVLAGVEPGLLLPQADRLRGELPVGIQASWLRPLAHRCAMFDINSWNQRFPNLHLARDPA